MNKNTSVDNYIHPGLTRSIRREPRLPLSSLTAKRGSLQDSGIRFRKTQNMMFKIQERNSSIK